VLAIYNPNFYKYFFLYKIVSDTSLIVVLTQKDELNNEQPISFMRPRLKGPELKYPTTEKQAYTIYKAIKDFKP